MLICASFPMSFYQHGQLGVANIGKNLNNLYFCHRNGTNLVLLMLSRNLKILRKANGLTQEQVASFLGIGRSAYSNYEEGIREPSIDILEKFANIMGCDLSTLFEEDENAVKSQLICAFRTEDLSDEDMEEVASFKRLVLSYLKMERLLNNEKTD